MSDTIKIQVNYFDHYNAGDKLKVTKTERGMVGRIAPADEATHVFINMVPVAPEQRGTPEEFTALIRPINPEEKERVKLKENEKRQDQ